MSEKRDITDFLQDAIDAMEKAEQFISDISFEDFRKDEKTVFAVIRAVEVVGEATKPSLVEKGGPTGYTLV